MSEYLDLYDYRCRVAALYRERMQALFDGEEGETVLRRFRQGRDDLFMHHPQSALDEAQRRHFQGLCYFPYNPALRFAVEIEPVVERSRRQVVMNAEESMMMTTIGRVSFVVDGESATLSIYWLDLYGGGLFLPFRDASSPQESYGEGDISLTPSKGVILCPFQEFQDGSRLSWTSITLITLHVPIMLVGRVHLPLLRMFSQLLFAPEKGIILRLK